MTRHILDHISLSVADFAGAKAFYTAALAPLGIAPMIEFSAEVTGSADVVGFGTEGKPFFWLVAKGKQTPDQHIAFGTDTRAEVDAFYEAALAAGGKDNGPPGLRPLYHPDYYGAFVRDPDGHNIEAVCHAPE